MVVQLDGATGRANTDGVTITFLGEGVVGGGSQLNGKLPRECGRAGGRGLIVVQGLFSTVGKSSPNHPPHSFFLLVFGTIF